MHKPLTQQQVEALTVNHKNTIALCREVMEYTFADWQAGRVASEKYYPKMKEWGDRLTDQERQLELLATPELYVKLIG